MSKFRPPRFWQKQAIIQNGETIVKLSSVVQNSLTHLDLSLCEYSIFTGKRKNKAMLELNIVKYSKSFTMKISNDFHCTKENLKRFFEKYHPIVACNVDLAIDLHNPFKYCTILIPHGFYENILPGIVDYAIERMKQDTGILRLKMARNILKTYKSYILNEIPDFVSDLAHIFYSDCTDLDIWREFFGAFPIEEYILFAAYYMYSPGVTERLLNYAFLSGFNSKQNSLNRDLILHCFTTELHSKVKVFLKFISAPMYCPYTHQQLRSDLFNSSHHLGLVDPMKLVREKPSNKGRSFLMLQVIHAFLLYNHKGRLGLRLIWRSIPDAYLTRKEMADQYEKIVTSRHLADIWNFYKEVVPASSCLKPRSLQHYSRVCIRTALSDNGQLYEGIDKLDIPTQLKWFLKLAE